MELSTHSSTVEPEPEITACGNSLGERDSGHLGVLGSLWIFCAFGTFICAQWLHFYSAKWWSLPVPLFLCFVFLFPLIKGRHWDVRKLVLQTEMKQRMGYHTFSYLADPVLKMFTVNIIPGHTRIAFQLSTVFSVCIIIWLSICPIFIWNLN